MKGNQIPVAEGGLMRCCLATIAKHDQEVLVGDTLCCQYEKEHPTKMVVYDSPKGPAWKWIGSGSN